MNGMPEHTPLISILIPSYNHERYVEQTIRSVWAQPYQQIEIIVIDDCSSDNSLALLQRLQAESTCRMLVQVNKERRGPAATVNRAIGLSKGELLALFASDDLYAEDPFSGRARLFQQDSDLQIVYGNGQRFDGQNTRGAIHDKKVNDLLAMGVNEILTYLQTHTSPLYMQSALLKKDLMLKIGCFDESLRADDWVINTKIFQELATSGGKHAYVDESVFLYRIHETNLHKNLSHHTALKLEFIEKITPEHLKGIARFNILYGAALTALEGGHHAQAIDLFRRSQQSVSDLKKTFRFFRKLVVSATLGQFLRKRKHSQPS